MAHWIFTEEHKLFRHAIRKFVHKEVTPYIEEWEHNETIPRRFFTRLGELGYLGISQQEKYGGSNLDTITEAILIEELVKAGAAGPALAVIHHLSALCYVSNFGSEEAKEQYLRNGIAGTFIFTTSSSRKKTSELVVKRGENAYWSEGQVTLFSGETGDIAIVQAKTEDENANSLFLVELKSEGIHCSSGKKLLGWRSLKQNQVSFENVSMPIHSLIGFKGYGEEYRKEAAHWEHTMTAICCVMLAENALDAAKRYSQERVQFGKPIASFQALRHMMADMAVAIEKSRAITYRSLYLLSQEDRSPTFPAIKTMALKNAVEMVTDVCDHALQIHGGAGYMMEFPIQRYWRDGKMFSSFYNEELKNNRDIVNWLNHSKGGQGLAEKNSVTSFS
ncbi:acyl-CoA dehydrogenase family protein [Sutcliffiella sp. NPDC057660]|uniref:acyl-CoA dehydrogenase family protein n=1 Tax=Sutcliffiella sp. NPDC057660 TaxID=3346199 RepID=UPI00369CE82C